MSYTQFYFPGKNKKVVGTTYHFLQKLSISQKIKMADLESQMPEYSTQFEYVSYSRHNLYIIIKEI